LTFLDKGESKTIALAIEIGADLILLDDSDARQAADFHGLKKMDKIGMISLGC
jgi:predicted nucleic acid-binding protein